MRLIRCANSRLMASYCDAAAWRGRAIGLPLRPRGRGRALGQAAVPAHVAALGARDVEDDVVLPHVGEAAHGRRVDPRHRAGLHAMRGPVPEAHLERARVDEVELLLVLVEVI